MIHHYLISLKYSMMPYDLDRNFQGSLVSGIIHLALIWGRVIKGQFSQDFSLEHIIF